MNIASLVIEGKESINNDTIKYREYINNLITNQKLNILEYSYLLDFGAKCGCITNLSWFIDIINALDDTNGVKIIKNAFPGYFRIKDHKLSVNRCIKKGVCKLESIKLTREQKKGAKEVIDFIIDKDQKCFGLYGFAGTGKTTTSVELINYLVVNKFINSVVFTAPTNKAVSVIKSKFRPHLRKIYEKRVHKTLAVDFDFENAIDALYAEDVKIDFITIHKLLKFKTDYGTDGGLIFTRNTSEKNSSLIDQYELVIIDECSMISLDMLDTIFDDIRHKNKKKGSNFKKVPKIIFTGDPAQLPPVNESRSFIFIKSEDELTLGEYQKHMEATSSEYITSDMNEIVNDKRKALIADMTNMKSFLLTNVVRSKIDTVTKVCHEIRKWVNGDVPSPELSQYTDCEGVYLYKYTKNVAKTNTEWFNRCIDYLKNNKCSIILTWTNRQSNEYNDKIRELMFGKEGMKDKFLKGDILMLTEFYCLDIEDDKLDSRFYTSDQISVVDTDRVVYNIKQFEFNTTKSIRGIKGYVQIEGKCKQFINFVNQYIKNLSFKCWALCVQKIGDDRKKYHVVRILDDDDKGKYNTYKSEISGYIVDFSRKMISNYKEKQSQIERLIINALWKQWHLLLIAPFANVNYGYSISCHKGQGSNFYNVFVDVNDILQNTRESEVKKCLYTAATRAVNELFLLI